MTAATCKKGGGYQRNKDTERAHQESQLTLDGRVWLGKQKIMRVIPMRATSFTERIRLEIAVGFLHIEICLGMEGMASGPGLAYCGQKT